MTWKQTQLTAREEEEDEESEESEEETCERCGSEVREGLCSDETCPFSDHKQRCPVGFHGHPERDNDLPCRCDNKRQEEG